MNEVIPEISQISNFSDFAELLCLIQGIVFGVLLINLSSGKKPSFYMGMFLLSWGLYFTAPILGSQGYLTKYPLLVFVPFNLSLLCFPFLFLYIKGLVGEYSFSRDKMHLYPGVILIIVFLLLFFFFLDVPGDVIRKHTYYLYGILILIVLVNVFIIVYLLKMLGLIRTNEVKVLEVFSSVEFKLLTWLKSMIYAFIFLTISDLFFTIFQIILKDDPLIYSKVYRYLNVQDVVEVIVTYWAAIFAIKQSGVWHKNIVLSVPQKVRGEIIVDLDDLFERLIDTIENTSCFKNMDLTIVDLANLMDIHYGKLSKVIKQKTNMNFNTFINKYRIEEAKSIIRDPQKFKGLTFEVLGQEVGFKAKSSFYNAFKKFEETTPLKFQKSQYY